eukprot:6174829-Pleurochrysis_carterae.AAC.1
MRGTQEQLRAQGLDLRLKRSGARSFHLRARNRPSCTATRTPWAAWVDQARIQAVLSRPSRQFAELGNSPSEPPPASGTSGHHSPMEPRNSEATDRLAHKVATRRTAIPDTRENDKSIAARTCTRSRARP